MMTNKLLAAVSLLSVMFWTGCATGGGGHTGSQIQVVVSTNPAHQSVVGVTLTVQFVATVTGTSNTAVTWSLMQSGTACTAACGTINASGLYTAPATPPNPQVVNVVATSVENPTKSDTYTMKVLPITVTVMPGPATVGVGLQQQFTASVVPDAAPQTVTWSIPAGSCPASDCGSVDASTGLYSAPNTIPSGGTFSLQATSTIDSPNWIGVSNITVAPSRLSGSYAFRFSGYDAADKPVAIAGNFVANNDGTIQGGAQDELTVSGHNRCTILSTSRYTLDANNHGALTLKTSSGACAVNARTYNFVLNSAGDGQMIEFDLAGRGSGKLAQADKTDFSSTKLNGAFAFGFSGTNIISGKRTGSAGLFVADGAGGIGSGTMDINEGGSATAITGFDPASSQYSISSDGSGTLTLVDSNTAATYQFAIYVVGGKTQNATNPLTLYAISTDPLANHPAVVGTIVFQDKTQTFDKSALNGLSVANLTGLQGSNSSVSLISASGDGNGNVSATYDANNAGTIVAAKAFNSTYTATGGGRYTLDLLNPAVHFVLYLSAANRGFLLDESSASVYTGAIDVQTGSSFTVSEMTGPFEAATGSTATPGGNQVAMNLLNSFTLPNFTLAGAQDETDGGQHSGQSVAGTGTLVAAGTGTITLTAPSPAKYVFYTLDNPKPSNMIQHFVMINVDSANTNPTVIFGER